MSTRLLIAEPETLLAELLGAHLRASVPKVSVQKIRTVGELQLATFDLAIVDVVLADGDIMEWLRSRQAARKDAKVIVLTACEQDVLIHAVLQSGVASIVHKAESLAFFDAALQAVLAGGSIVSPRMQAIRTRLHADPNLYAKILSLREQMVLRGIAAGHSVHSLARELGIRDATVVDHRKNIMGKLDLHTQSELLAYALEKGFAPTAPQRRRHRRA